LGGNIIAPPSSTTPFPISTPPPLAGRIVEIAKGDGIRTDRQGVVVGRGRGRHPDGAT